MKGSLGYLLLILGLVMLLGMLGINVGWIIGIIIPSYFIYKGWKVYSNNESGFKKFFGAVLITVGLLWLLGMLHFIVGIVISTFLIYFGYQMIKRQKALIPEMADDQLIMSSSNFTSSYSFDDLDEWEKKLKK